MNSGRSPNSALQATLERAIRLHSAGELGAAQAGFRDVLKAQPRNAVALNLLGLIDYQMGRFAEAEKLIKRAVKVQPDFAGAHNNLGLALQEQKRFREAATHYRKAIKLAPEMFIAEMNLGNVLLELDRAEDAIGHFHKAIAREPGYANAHYNLGNALKHLERFEEAAAAYAKALEITPDYVEARGNLGVVLHRLDRSDEAIGHLQKVIEIAPAFAEAHYNLGFTLMETGRSEQALAHFHRTLELRPDFAAAHESLGDALKRLERFDEAAAEFDRAGRKWSAAKALECLFAAGRYDELRERLVRSAETDVDNIRVAALSAFAADLLGHADPHRFCPNPLDFLREFRCHDDPAEREAFLSSLLGQLQSITMTWEPHGQTTTKGYQSRSDLLNEPTGPLAELNRILRDRIATYRAEFAGETCTFIRHWPKKWALDAWSVRLVKGGRQAEHIHPDGWLSGVIYLQMPRHCAPGEGEIEFGLWGIDYGAVNTDYPRRRLAPEDGKIVLFPSSLYHRTIPFSSDEERVCIAFDVMRRR